MESYLLQLPLKDSCIMHVRLPIGQQRPAILNMFIIGRRPPDDAPTADAWSGIHSHWPSRQHWGVGSANVKRTLEESTWWPCCHMASCRRSPQTPLARAETALSFCSKEQFRSSHELDFSTNWNLLLTCFELTLNDSICLPVPVTCAMLDSFPNLACQCASWELKTRDRYQ